ncbi:penicillin-binding protein, partial [Streptomyces sp. NPDC088178]
MTHPSSPADADFGHTAPHRHQNRRPGLRAGIAVTVMTAVVAGGAYAAGLGSFEPDDTPDPAATAQARAFLADWAGGRLDSAGSRTTSPARAEEVLRNFT